ncbi:MAG: DUF5110 domain-containing protein, partial [Anaerolineae bacterium]
PNAMSASAPLEHIPIYVRAGTVLPTWPVMQYTGEKPIDRLILHVYPGDGLSWLYEDDGHSLAYQHGEYRVTSFLCQRKGESSLHITRQTQGAYQPSYTRWEWHIHGLAQAPAQVLADGAPIQNILWDGTSQVLRFETGEARTIELG